jgi:hypothetical protein
MTFSQRLRFFEKQRGVGGREPGGAAGFYHNPSLHGRDFGQVSPRPRNIYEDEPYGSPSIETDSEDGLPAALNPYINEDEEEIFGGEARADLNGVRRNTTPYAYYDDLSDLR